MKTLKNVVHACVIAVLVVAVPAYGPVYGQVIEEEDDDVYRRSSTADKFFGTAGSVFVNSSSARASYQSLELGYDTLFAQERGRFYFSGVGTNTGLELDLELTEEARRENEDSIAKVIRDNRERGPDDQKVPEERSAQQVIRELDEDNFAVKDAFVQYNFSDNLQFTTGRRRVAWGQFDLISPVNPRAAADTADRRADHGQNQYGGAARPGIVYVASERARRGAGLLFPDYQYRLSGLRMCLRMITWMTFSHSLRLILSLVMMSV